MMPLDPNESGRHGAPHGRALPTVAAVLGALALLLTGGLSTFMVLQLDASRPRVGDIIVFRPGTQDTDTGQMAIAATVVRDPGGAAMADCALDANAMAEHGGSLIVESRQEIPLLQYHIHWAGGETAHTSGSCGGSADLLVSRTDLQRLANSAGGFGIGR